MPGPPMYEMPVLFSSLFAIARRGTFVPNLTGFEEHVAGCADMIHSFTRRNVEKRISAKHGRSELAV